MAKPIGQILKEEGYIDDQMINYALKVQKATRERLGDTLLRLRFVTDEEIARVLAKQAGLEYYSLEGYSADLQTLRQVPYNFAQKAEVLPVEIADDTLILAIADPFNEASLQAISRFTSYQTKFVVAPRARLNNQIEHTYYLAENPVSAEIDKIVEQVSRGQAFQAEKVAELLVNSAIELGASDMHITSAAFATLVSYRIDGVLQLRYSLPSSMHTRTVSVFKVESGMDIAEMHRPQDGRMTINFLKDQYELRVSCVPTSNGDNLVIRFLAAGAEIRSLDRLGYDGQQLIQISDIISQPYGMILVTGPTGSGKSTTLYGALRRINSMEKNVMTIEDPVEFDMPLVRQVAVNNKAGITFSSAIRSFLRQDPDVILIGEIRDEETAGLATRASQTGHLVLSTLHTNDAAGAIARLRDLQVGNFILATTLTAVISQRLVRKLCPYCKEAVSLDELDQRYLGVSSDEIFVHQGCDHCHDTGYLGRTTVAEILVVDDAIKDLIDSNASPTEIRIKAIKNGMQTLRQATLNLINQGVIDLDEANRVVQNVQDEEQGDDQVGGPSAVGEN